MTRPYLPHTFRDGATLDVEALRENFEQMAADLDDSTGKRNSHFPLVLPFPSLDQASGTALRQVKFKPSFALEIVARELIVYGTSGETFTVTADSTGWVDLSVDGLGASTKARVGDELSSTVAADGTITVEVDSDASTWAADIEVVLWCRADRFSGSLPSAFSVPSLDASVQDTASTLNTAITNYATDVTADTNASTQRRIEAHLFPLSQAGYTGGEAYVWLPDYGDTIRRVFAYACASGACTVEVDLLDEGANTLATATVTIVSAAGQVGEANLSPVEAQPGSGHGTVGNDYSLFAERTVGSSTIHRLIVFVEYEG